MNINEKQIKNLLSLSQLMAQIELVRTWVFHLNFKAI